MSKKESRPKAAHKHFNRFDTNTTRGRFNRETLPKPSAYFKARGLRLKGRGLWRKTICTVCGGADMLLVTTSGGFVCKSCGVRGGDLLALYRLETGAGFIEAARALGAWLVVP